MNTIEQTNDIVKKIEFARSRGNGRFTLLLHDGKKLENIKYHKLSVSKENPKAVAAFLEYTTDVTNELSMVNILEVKSVV
jgi:hypothetical protein